MEPSIYEKLEAAVTARARELDVELITIGLGYTAVSTSDGSCGVSFTYFTRKDGCTVVKDPMDYEGKRAAELLPLIHSPQLIERAVAIALINALIKPETALMENDSISILDRLLITNETKCAMVGYFGPVVAKIKEAGAMLEVVDESKGMGDQEKFYRYIEKEADALILTSTSIINGTAETVLGRLNPEARCCMIGPTTPMIPEAFSHLPVDYLGGISINDGEKVQKAVRHGKGTPVINRFSRKISCPVHQS